MKPGKAVRGQHEVPSCGASGTCPALHYTPKVKNLYTQEKPDQPQAPRRGVAFLPSLPHAIAHHQAAWHGGDSEAYPRPPKHQKKEKLHTQHFTKSSFLQFFAIFPPARALCERKHPQTMTFWWVNYDFLVGDYDNLVGSWCVL